MYRPEARRREPRSSAAVRADSMGWVKGYDAGCPFRPSPSRLCLLVPAFAFTILSARSKLQLHDSVHRGPDKVVYGFLLTSNVRSIPSGMMSYETTPHPLARLGAFCIRHGLICFLGADAFCSIGRSGLGSSEQLIGWDGLGHDHSDACVHTCGGSSAQVGMLVVGRSSTRRY